jgi:transcriptional regulator with XRE-family HTH domain
MSPVNRTAIGAYIREQREQAKISLRQLADNAGVSNPYLSQIERGLHEPSVRVLRSIASALNISADTLLAQAGLLDGSEPPSADDVGEGPEREATTTEAAIRLDPALTESQKEALLAVYRGFVGGGA